MEIASLVPTGARKRHAKPDRAAQRTKRRPVGRSASHPTAIRRYLEQIEQLSLALATGKDLALGEPAAVFRSLIERVIVYPVPARAKLDLEIRGYLATLTQDPRMAPSKRMCGFEVVAEVRYSRNPIQGATYAIRA